VLHLTIRTSGGGGVGMLSAMGKNEKRWESIGTVMDFSVEDSPSVSELEDADEPRHSLYIPVQASRRTAGSGSSSVKRCNQLENSR